MRGEGERELSCPSGNDLAGEGTLDIGADGQFDPLLICALPNWASESPTFEFHHNFSWIRLFLYQQQARDEELKPQRR